jgi:peroxiredoxin
MRRFHLLTFYVGLLCASLLFVACSDGRPPSGDTGPSITLDDLPTGLGRGYPQATVAEIDNASAGIRVGDRAPNFHMQLDDGRTLTMEELQGRPVLLNHWATWCGPCRLEMPEILKAAQEHPELAVLAVNMMETKSQIEPFAAEFQMEIPIIIDPEGKVRDLYGVRGLPTTILVDREGKISTIWAGLLTRAKLDELLARVQ